MAQLSFSLLLLVLLWNNNKAIVPTTVHCWTTTTTTPVRPSSYWRRATGTTISQQSYAAAAVVSSQQQLLVATVALKSTKSSSSTSSSSTSSSSTSSSTSSSSSNQDNTNNDDDLDYNNDEQLLQHVAQDQLLQLCHDLKITIPASTLNDNDNDTTTTKSNLLQLLRNYATQKANEERLRTLQRKERVESDNENGDPKERYEIVNDDYELDDDDDDDDNDNDDDEEGGYFYYAIPEVPLSSSSSSAAQQAMDTATATATAADKDSEPTITSSSSTSLLSSDSTLDEGNNNKHSSSLLSTADEPTTPVPAAAADQPTASGSSSSSSGGGNSRSRRTIVTAPPPPDQVNELGERVVTVYSTSDQNDMTGVAAAQPGASAASMELSSVMHENSSSSSLSRTMGGTSANTAGRIGSDDTEQQQQQQSTQSKAAQNEALEQAEAIVTELVQTLLSHSGAPAFALDQVDDDDDDDDDDKNDNNSILSSIDGIITVPRSAVGKGSFIGFQPANVPPTLLTPQVSRALRCDTQILDNVMHKMEIKAIGWDGMRGDDKDKGGGHYREVQKVHSFLQGYTRSEQVRVARYTTTLLLDKLVQEGVQGLDVLLASMARHETLNPYGSGSGGEAWLGSEQEEYDSPELVLNDALLNFLKDAIRQQEKKVQQQQRPKQSEQIFNKDYDDVDVLENLWNVTTNDAGDSIHSLDPKDPRVEQVLRDEYEREQTGMQPQRAAAAAAAAQQQQAPAPEKLLLLLRLLQERIKTEAAFVPARDEKGANLRVLAYCLQVSTDIEREQLIQNHVGSSLDKLDSFIELVASSVEYGESTSYQLQPARQQTLNVPQLQKIQSLAHRMRKLKAFKASNPGFGLSTSSQLRP